MKIKDNKLYILYGHLGECQLLEVLAQLSWTLSHPGPGFQGLHSQLLYIAHRQHCYACVSILYELELVAISKILLLRYHTSHAQELVTCLQEMITMTIPLLITSVIRQWVVVVIRRMIMVMVASQVIYLSTVSAD